MSAKKGEKSVLVSYEHGVSDIPLRGLTVGNLLKQTAASFPYSEALIVPYQDVRWSYRELDTQVAVSYTHLTLPTMLAQCRSRWSPYH